MNEVPLRRDIPSQTSSGSKRTSSNSAAAPSSWLTSLSLSAPSVIRSKFKQDWCGLCEVTHNSEFCARNHFKGKRHAENVNNLKPRDTTESILEVSEVYFDYDEEVMLSDDIKEVITISESCSAPPF